MKLLLLLDKKPGHFHQVEGIAKVIARLVPVEAQRLPVRGRLLAHNDVLRRLMRRKALDPVLWLRRLYGIETENLTPPDAIIGSGRPTIAAGILLKRLTGAPFIYSGQINGYDTTDVALQIVNSPRAGGHPRSAYAPIPCTIDPDALPPPRRLAGLPDLVGAEVSLLVGGKAHGHTYTADEWDALGRLVGEVADRYGVRWRISTSRRSPPELTDRFVTMAATGRIAEFVDYRSAGAGSADRLYGADAVVVTEDSTSMLSEGLAARRPVIALKPARVEASSANETVAAMAAGPAMAVLPLATVDAEQFARSLVRLRVEGADPRDRIAAVIAPVLGLDWPPVQPRQTAS